MLSKESITKGVWGGCYIYRWGVWSCLYLQFIFNGDDALNKKATIIISVFIAFVLGVTISFLFTPTSDDIPYTVLDDSSIESHITKSYLNNGNLIIDIYNPNCEIVKVKPATIEHHVTAGMDSVKIFNYADQYFEIIVGNASDVYTFGSLTKTWDAKNKAVTIKSNGMPSMTVRLISSEPDLCTFTEIFEVTNFKASTPHKDKDFKARTVKHKGKKDVTKVEWFIEQNISYVVNVTDYKVVSVDSEIHNNRTGINETIQINKTVVAGYHDEIRYKIEWQEYNHHGKPVSKDTVQRIKVVYHKLPEIGEFSIQTIPKFRGIECEELTWWNGDWSYKINSVVADDSYPYQMNLTVHSASGTNNATDVFLDGHNSTNFDDIRFTLGNSIDLSYWIEDNSTDPMKVWVNVTANGTVNMYYGNAAASSTSIGSGVFPDLYRSFESDSDGYSAGARSTEQSYDEAYSYKLTNDVDVEAIQTRPFPTVLTNHIYMHSQSGQYSYRSYIYLNAVNKYAGVYAGHPTALNWGYLTNGVWTNSGIAHNTGQWNQMEYILKTTTWSCSVNGVVIATDAAYTTSSVTNRIKHRGVGSGTGISYLDCEYIREYASPEPTWGTWGAEEVAFNIVSYAPSTPLNKLESESQYFNVTTDSNCQCRWYINGSLKQTNTTQQTDHNYTNTSLELGYYNFSAVVNTTDGVTDIQTWWVTVESIATYIPPPPVLSNTTGGDFWANFTWTSGSGNTTNSYNVSYNDVWDNGTTTTHRNESVSGGGWHNITVCAWNSSGVGTLSDTCVEDSIEAPSYKPSEPINLANTTGNFWVNHTWQADSGNVTDYWNVSVNDVWYNRSYPWYNGTYSAHDWQNISVWAWNNTAQGTMSD